LPCKVGAWEIGGRKRGSSELALLVFRSKRLARSTVRGRGSRLGVAQLSHKSLAATTGILDHSKDQERRQ
jgi:hypothetical protein